MLNPFLKITRRSAVKPLSISFLLLCAVIPTPSFAQECNIQYEMVTRLHHPDPGSFTVWDAAFGEAHRQEKFTSVINWGDEGNVLAVGLSYALKGVTPSLMFVEFDRRGRKVSDRYFAMNGLRDVVKILSHKDGYIVLMNREVQNEPPSIMVGFFGANGKLKSRQILADKSFDLYATDIIPSVAGGWALSVRTAQYLGAGKHKKRVENTSIFLLNDKGKQVLSRSYVLGKSNTINDLSVSKFKGSEGGYIATGYFENDFNKKIAWILRLNADASLVWQKEFSRGVLANLQKSLAYDSRHIVVLGDVIEPNNDLTGSWVAMLDAVTGDVVWQRYFYGETGYHHYKGRDLMVNEDGLISVLMMAQIDKEQMKEAQESAEIVEQDEDNLSEMDYAHLLTLSPRGVTLSGDSYFSGEGVHVSQMIKGGSGHHVMVGDVFTDHGEHETSERDSSLSGVNVPLSETERITSVTPDGGGADNSGLTLLQKKIKAQAADEGDHENHEESANVQRKVSQDGWILVGDGLDAYTDPCR